MVCPRLLWFWCGFCGSVLVSVGLFWFLWVCSGFLKVLFSILVVCSRLLRFCSRLVGSVMTSVGPPRFLEVIFLLCWSYVVDYSGRFSILAVLSLLLWFCPGSCGSVLYLCACVLVSVGLFLVYWGRILRFLIFVLECCGFVRDSMVLFWIFAALILVFVGAMVFLRIRIVCYVCLSLMCFDCFDFTLIVCDFPDYFDSLWHSLWSSVILFCMLRCFLFILIFLNGYFMANTSTASKRRHYKSLNGGVAAPTNTTHTHTHTHTQKHNIIDWWMTALEKEQPECYIPHGERTQVPTATVRWATKCNYS